MTNMTQEVVNALAAALHHQRLAATHLLTAQPFVSAFEAKTMSTAHSLVVDMDRIDKELRSYYAHYAQESSNDKSS